MNLMYSRTQDNMKRSLAYMNDIYKHGWVNEDAVVAQRTPSAYDAFRQGRAGMFNEFGGNAAGYTVEIQKINPKGEADYLVGIKNDKGVVQGSSYGTGVWGYTRSPPRPRTRRRSSISSSGPSAPAGTASSGVTRG